MKSIQDVLPDQEEPEFVDINSFLFDKEDFNSLDHISDFTAVHGDPMNLCIRKEKEQGAPLALCRDETVTTVINRAVPVTGSNVQSKFVQHLVQIGCLITINKDIKDWDDLLNRDFDEERRRWWHEQDQVWLRAGICRPS